TVQIPPTDHEMELGAAVDRIDTGQADEADGIRFSINENRAADVAAAPAQVVIEPRLIDFFGDVSSGRSEAIDKIPILPPSIDDRNVLSREFAETHHRMTSATAATTRPMCSAPYR